ncbi:hypothetical protein [Mesorhizobium sp. LSJC265A00]|uniref:hypothetical protein n=1 Tax=Mesorhizobium sp. LSJC265A00 TaxID=1287322 RepID=UPI0012EB19A4|nr:hypothetical protein [Mesorhizobium sp. LSJC265A00]
MNNIWDFSMNEAGYVAWLGEYPEGFVVNLRQGPSSGYAVLRRASCSLVSQSKLPHGAFTERSYRKLCGTTVADLTAALRKTGNGGGSLTKRCSVCEPE